MGVEEQVVSIFAGTRGYLDRLEVGQIGRFEAQLLEQMRAKHADTLETIRKERELSKATEEKLTQILDAFTKSFA
jgi:F-type H+-transporting ATPase subunit alpha